MPSITLRALCALALLGSVAACSSSSSAPLPTPVTASGSSFLAPLSTFKKNPNSKYGHVFVVLLENKDESTTYGTGSPAKYLQSVVKPAGAFLPNYYATGHASLDNYISLVSGQAPNALTSADCPDFLNFTNDATGTYGQALGTGCVFPANVPNLSDQLRAANIPWRSYNEDMGNDPAREAATCGHPALDAADNTESAEAPSSANGGTGDQYATRHNPFMYFHTVIDDQAYCAAHVVDATRFASDLKTIATTPNFAFYTPNLCNDGHDGPCVTNSASNPEPGNYTGIDTFIHSFVPLVTKSPAFKADGLLIILFDESASTNTACCGEMPGLNGDPLPGEQGQGGGTVGAVLLSPFIKPGTISQTTYNHYAFLGSIEDIFGLSHIGYAAQSGLNSFGTDPTINTAGSAKTDVAKLVSGP